MRKTLLQQSGIEYEMVVLVRTDQQLIRSVIVAALGANTVTREAQHAISRSPERATCNREPEGEGIAARQIMQSPRSHGPAAPPKIADKTMGPNRNCDESPGEGLPKHTILMF